MVLYDGQINVKVKYENEAEIWRQKRTGGSIPHTFRPVRLDILGLVLTSPNERLMAEIKTNPTIFSKIFKECLTANTRRAEFHIDLSENDNGVEIIQSGVIDLLYRHNDSWKIDYYKLVSHLDQRIRDGDGNKGGIRVIMLRLKL